MFEQIGSTEGIWTKQVGALATPEEIKPLLAYKNLCVHSREQPNMIYTNLYIVDFSERKVSQTEQNVRFPQSKRGYRISLAADTKMFQSS